MFSKKNLYILIIAYTLLFATISLLKYISLSYSLDLTVFNQVIWATSNGRLFYSSLFPNNTFLSEHFTPIILLIAIPYKLFPHPMTLLLLQTIALALGAIPVYLIAREKLNSESAGLALAFVYLLYPALGYLNLTEFPVTVLATPLLLMMFYYFEKEKFGKYLLFMILSLSCKENISIVVFMFSIYALMQRKSAKWVLTPLVLSTIWFYMATEVIISHYRGSDYSFFSRRYGYLGKTTGEIVKTIITNPIFVLKTVLIKDKIIYLLLLLTPLAFLSLFLSAIILALPTLLQNLLTNYPEQYGIYTHYSAPLISFMIISTVHGIKNLSKKVNLRYLIFILLTATILSNFLILTVREKPFNLEDRDKIGWSLINEIPKTAAVSADHSITPALSNRYNVHIFNRGGVPPNTEYLLLDYEKAKWPGPETYRTNADKYINNKNWQVISNQSGYILLRKNA